MTTLNKQINLPVSESDQFPKVYQVSLFSESYFLASYPIKEFPLHSSTEKSVIIVTRRNDGNPERADDAVLVKNSWKTQSHVYFLSRKEAEDFWKARLNLQIEMAEKRILEAKEAIAGLHEASKNH